MMEYQMPKDNGNREHENWDSIEKMPPERIMGQYKDEAETMLEKSIKPREDAESGKVLCMNPCQQQAQ